MLIVIMVHFILVAITQVILLNRRCHTELTFAASVAALMRFILYLFRSAIE